MLTERSLWECASELAAQTGAHQFSCVSALAEAIVANHLTARIALQGFPLAAWEQVLSDFPYPARCIDLSGEPSGDVYVMVLRHTLIPSSDFEDWARARDLLRTRHGPAPGSIDRYGDADRSLFPEIDELIRDQKLSLSAATQKLANEGRVDGVGDPCSRAKRLARRYQKDRLTVPS
jgi:hypothetical protein